MNIAISIGHHKDAQGAEYNGVTEYALATGWAHEVASLVDGSFVVSGTLNKKVKEINDREADLAIEIHFNSFKVWEDANKNGIIDDNELKNAGKGSETLYYPGSSKGELFASCVQNHLGKIATPDRGIKKGWYRMDKERGPDYFLLRTKCPAIIVEPEFIHRLDRINNIKHDAIYHIAVGITEAYSLIYGG